MLQLDSPEIKEYILGKLKKSVGTDDIILAVCEKTGLNWEESRTFVEQIAVEKRDDIILYQSPLLFLLALVIFLFGAQEFFQIVFAVSEHAQPLKAEEFIVTLVVAVSALAGGIGMILGSLKGMREIWEVILKKIGIR